MEIRTNSFAYVIPGIHAIQKMIQEVKVVKPKSPEEKVKMIIAVILYEMSITEAELTSKCRRGDYSFARYVAYYFITKYTPFVYVKIGAMFSGRDYSTVSAGIYELSRIIDQNYRGYGEIFDIIKKNINKFEFQELKTDRTIWKKNYKI